MTLMIGLPCAGGIVSEKTTLGLFNLGKTLVRNNINHGLLTLTNSSLITQARSKVVNFFINNTEHEYLFFLDSDIGFNPDDVLKLMSHQIPIVSGAYPMKIIPERYCVDVVQPEERHGDLLKINGNGMGFVLIHRQVFLDIARHYPNLKYVPSNYHSDTPHSPEEMNNSFHFFAEHQSENGFMSEDKSFFHRAKQVGYNIFLDTSIRLNHTGYHIYQG
jgi:glycosyltransferase involved in cell wall biosynthesis